MKKHKHYGFTIVELLIVIIVIAILATITGIAYRTTQNNAKDEATKTNAMMLVAAIDEYYNAKGVLPWPVGGTDEGGAVCAASAVYCLVAVTDNAFKMLVDEKLLRSIPKQGDGKNFYIVMFRLPATQGDAYAIRVNFIDTSKNCKTGKNVRPESFGSTRPVCGF